MKKIEILKDAPLARSKVTVPIMDRVLIMSLQN